MKVQERGEGEGEGEGGGGGGGGCEGKRGCVGWAGPRAVMLCRLPMALLAISTVS